MRRRLSAVGHRFVLALLWASCGALAQTPAPVLVHPGEAMPTRLTLCQREIRGMKGAREPLMRRCLSRRLEGERIIERNCRRRVARIGGAVAQQQAQRECVQQALMVRSDELPKRPPPPPPVAPAAAVDAGQAIPAAVPAPASRLPAAGEN